VKNLLLIILIFVALLKTQAKPIPVVIESVSILPNGDAVITWQASPEANIEKYYIKYFFPATGNTKTVDSVLVGTTTFTIPLNLTVAPVGNVNASNDLSNMFVVTAKDNTGSESDNGIYHNTIFLEAPVHNKCAETMTVTWNAYDDFTSGHNVLYNVYVKKLGGPFVLDGSTTDINYIYSGANQSGEYQYYIEATENNGAGPFTSTSNIDTIQTEAWDLPTFPPYVNTLNVVDSQQLNVHFYVDTAADMSHYIIKRALDSTHVFTEIGAVNAYYGMDPKIVYEDFDVDANNQDYYYKIYPITICNVLESISNFGKSILLHVEENKIDATNTLTWTSYKGWLLDVEAFEIYRSIFGVWETSPVGTVLAPFSSLTYVDDLSNEFTGTGEFCYKVVARENAVTHVGGTDLPLQANSESNVDCVNHDPLFYIPNAFDPNSTDNPVFKPVLSYSDPLAYSMTIYDRWGLQIFETSDIYEGWNGSLNNSGNVQPMGVYIYNITFKSSTGKDFERQGTLTLLR